VNPEISATDRIVDRIARDTALDGIADALQPAVQRVLDPASATGSALSDFFHGRWLGHALHPLVTDIPVGAWSMGALFDGLEIIGQKAFAPAADACVLVGIAGAVAAAATGLAEWGDTKDEPRRLGTAHLLLNAAALTCYVASALARRANARRFGFAAAFIGYGATGAASFLGGELAFGYLLGAKHTAVAVEPSSEFTAVCAIADVGDGETRPATFDDLPILLTRRGQQISAVAAVCTHRGAPLQDAPIEGDCVTCPWHGSQFDLRDGMVRKGPATFDLARFEARVRAGSIEVRRAFA
jgi:nitrite reductase/ring-hydroxylating ferredoxin subunit